MIITPPSLVSCDHGLNRNWLLRHIYIHTLTILNSKQDSANNVLESDKYPQHDDYDVTLKKSVTLTMSVNTFSLVDYFGLYYKKWLCIKT